jgi:ABC-type multidrug transport system ATPase subunit
LYANKIYEIDWITPKTKINNLPGKSRKQLSLYSTLSKTNNIMLDLIGVDPLGAKEIYEIVKNEVLRGGLLFCLILFKI